MSDMETHENEAADVEAPEQQSGPQPDGLVVTVHQGGDGKVAFGIQTMGETTVMEASTILALARKQLHAQLGIGG